jgi:glycosyltransferase involved in cell wall biosynthesis
MLVANPFTDEVWTDPRVDKEARALLKAGHEVVVLGTGKYGQAPRRCEAKDGLKIIRRPTILHRLYTLLRPPRISERYGSRSRQVYYQDKQSQAVTGRLVAYLLQFMYDVNNVLFCLAILPQAIRQQADIYEGHDLNALPAAFLAARLTGARLVYDSHELWTERVRSVPYCRWHRALVSWVEKILCRRCDLVITMSKSVAQILTNRYNIPDPLVVPNAHPYTEVSPSPEIRAELGGETHRRVVIYVGYLDYGKGLEQLVDAVPYLKEDVCVAIVGDGVLRPALEARADKAKLGDRVLFTGWVLPDAVPRYVASADLGVSPIQGSWLNYYHNLDNKVFHYIAAGIPLAVSNQPEKRQLVEKYGIGSVFDETDPQDIARVINEILSDSAEYAEMRARCLKVAREELNWEVVSRRYVAAIEGLVTKNPGGEKEP